MWANRSIDVILKAISVILLPFTLLSTLILGILVSLTFGLLLIPFSLVWIVVFFGPLLILSKLWNPFPILRIPLALIGIPLAVLAWIFNCLTPHMGETESRIEKCLICETWPFTDDFCRFTSGKAHLWDKDMVEVEEILTKLTRVNPAHNQYVDHVIAHYTAVETSLSTQ